MPFAVSNEGFAHIVQPEDIAAGNVIGGYSGLPDGIGATISQTGQFSADAKDGPILTQSWHVPDQIRAIVEAGGGPMADVLKLAQYFRHLSGLPRHNTVLRLFLPAVPPVSPVVEVSALAPCKNVFIEGEATACLPVQG